MTQSIGAPHSIHSGYDAWLIVLRRLTRLFSWRGISKVLKSVSGRAVTSFGVRRNLVIVVMHRSGTAMVSGALVSSAFYTGTEDELMSPVEDNPPRFGERRDVAALYDGLLSAVKSTWFHPALVDWQQDVPEIKQLLEDLSSRNSRPIKDPRLIFKWPAWTSAVKTAAKLYVYRSPLALATSLRERDNFPLEHGLDWWEIYNRQAVKIMRAKGTALNPYETFSHGPKRAWEALLCAGKGRKTISLPLSVSWNLGSALIPKSTEKHVG